MTVAYAVMVEIQVNLSALGQVNDILPASMSYGR